MAKQRIISADSRVSIRDEAVLGHLASRHHEGYRQARRMIGGNAARVYQL
jgi:hypothetical protein